MSILLVILKRKKYALIAISSAIIFGIVSYYLSLANISVKSIFIYAEMNGVIYTIISSVLGLLTAILFGLYLTLLVFRKDIIKARSAGNKVSSLSGTAVGLIASGCPTCGAPLLGLIGFPLALYSLPFKGLELKVLSVIFLFLGIYLISKNIKKNLLCDYQTAELNNNQ